MNTVSANEIASRLRKGLIGENIEISGLSSINNPKPNTVLYWAEEEIPSGLSVNFDSCLVICNKQIETKIGASYIFVDNPRATFARIAIEYFYARPAASISKSAVIHPSVTIEKGVSIGNFVVIEENCSIGSNTFISDFVKISKGVTIGSDCYVGSHTSIGAQGFGLETDERGEKFRIPHFGSVVIKDQVEIGNNVSIAGGTIDNTFIDFNVKIDDHVFIAHNVEIGEGSVVVAGTEISGSAKLGKRCWIGPQVTIINKVSVGDDATVGIGSVVLRDIAPRNVVVGNPARVLREE